MQPTVPPTGCPFLCSWSGGKDSCLALHRALAAGAGPGFLLCMLDGEGLRSRSHGLRPEVVLAQAEAMGLSLAFGRASWQDYERVFGERLRRHGAMGVKDAVFGDIDLEEHRAWEERVCAEAGLRAHLPLWKAERWELLEEFWEAGFEATILAVKDGLLDPECIGRALDRGMAKVLGEQGVDVCGEYGEFHTVVTSGPLFARPLRWTTGALVLRDGYWFGDIRVAEPPAF